VKGSIDRCLVFDKSKTTTSNVTGFVDSDYGGDLDRRHSTSGYIFTLCAGASPGKYPNSRLQLHLILNQNTLLQLRE